MEETSEIYSNARDGSSLEAADYSYQAHGRNSNSLIQTQTTVGVREVEVGVEENIWKGCGRGGYFQILENSKVIEWIAHTWKGWNSFYPHRA